MNDLFSLAGKNILITGSAQDIGFLPVTGLNKCGARTVINDIVAECVRLAVEKLRQEGIQTVAAPFNVTHKREIDAAIKRIEKDVGPIDVLVNNAGIQRHYPLTELPKQEWNDAIAVSQAAVFPVSRMVTRHMVERKAGKIIDTCSMQSELGRNTITPYTASKGAVEMFTRGMCVELARHNIRVNGIAPDYFKTEMTEALIEDEALTAWLYKRTSAVRWGNSQELIGAAMFLSSKASGFINDHLLFVDGGMLMAIQHLLPYAQRKNAAFLALTGNKDYAINHYYGRRRATSYPDDRF